MGARADVHCVRTHVHVYVHEQVHVWVCYLCTYGSTEHFLRVSVHGGMGSTLDMGPQARHRVRT